jgi:hypothetical protein
MADDVVAALNRIGDELSAIRTLLQELATPEPEPVPSTECPHPLEARADFGMTNGLPDWQCRLCGFRTVTEP